MVNLCTTNILGARNKSVHLSNCISKFVSYDSNGKIMIYTDAAFRTKDGKTVYGFCVIKNNIPLVTVAHYGSRTSSSKEV